MSAARIAYGVAEAAEALGLRPHHVRQGIRDGSIRSYAVGRRTVILRSDLEDFIRQCNPPKSSRARINEARESAVA
jgi:excisionase family DNA binding protein